MAEFERMAKSRSLSAISALAALVCALSEGCPSPAAMPAQSDPVPPASSRKASPASSPAASLPPPLPSSADAGAAAMTTKASAQPPAARTNLICTTHAPSECALDTTCTFDQAQARYPRCVPQIGSSPYLARCGAYDSVVWLGVDTRDFTFFDRATGRIVGSIGWGPRGDVSCESYDPGFTATVALEVSDSARCQALDGDCTCNLFVTGTTLLACPNEHDAGAP